MDMGFAIPTPAHEACIHAKTQGDQVMNSSDSLVELGTVSGETHGGTGGDLDPDLVTWLERDEID